MKHEPQVLSLIRGRLDVADEFVVVWVRCAIRHARQASLEMASLKGCGIPTGLWGVTTKNATFPQRHVSIGPARPGPARSSRLAPVPSQIDLRHSPCSGRVPSEWLWALAGPSPGGCRGPCRPVRCHFLPAAESGPSREGSLRPQAPGAGVLHPSPSSSSMSVPVYRSRASRAGPNSEVSPKVERPDGALVGPAPGGSESQSESIGSVSICPRRYPMAHSSVRLLARPAVRVLSTHRNAASPWLGTRRVTRTSPGWNGYKAVATASRAGPVRDH